MNARGSRAGAVQQSLTAILVAMDPVRSSRLCSAALHFSACRSNYLEVTNRHFVRLINADVESVD